MASEKHIALVAHDKRKRNLLEWVRYNRVTLQKHRLFSTGTTGKLIQEELGIDVRILKSGPLGGDQQIGSLIADGKVDMLVFFWDPLEPLPHDSDVKALLRLAVVYNIPVACNRATADYIISSPLMAASYERQVDDYSDYLQRRIE